MAGRQTRLPVTGAGDVGPAGQTLVGSGALAAALEQDGVAPNSVELGDPGPHGQGAIASGVVQGQAGPVLGKDRSLQGPHPGPIGLDDLGEQQRLADASASGGLGDVDGSLAYPRVAGAL